MACLTLNLQPVVKPSRASRNANGASMQAARRLCACSGSICPCKAPGLDRCFWVLRGSSVTNGLGEIFSGLQWLQWPRSAIALAVTAVWSKIIKALLFGVQAALAEFVCWRMSIYHLVRGFGVKVAMPGPCRRQPKWWSCPTELLSQICHTWHLAWTPVSKLWPGSYHFEPQTWPFQVSGQTTPASSIDIGYCAPRVVVDRIRPFWGWWGPVGCVGHTKNCRPQLIVFCRW